MTVEVLDFWSSATVVESHRQTPEESFAAFCRRNSWFIPRLAQMSYEERLRGSTRGSMKLQFETLRRELPEVHTDNNWTALAARKVMELYPDLDGYYRTKARKS